MDRKPPQQNTTEFPTTFKTAATKAFHKYYYEKSVAENPLETISTLIVDRVQPNELFSKAADHSNIFHALFEAFKPMTFENKQLKIQAFMLIYDKLVALNMPPNDIAFLLNQKNH